MDYVFIPLMIILFVGLTTLSVHFYMRRGIKPAPMRENIEITLQDIIRLAATNLTSDINSLILAHGVNKRMPEFYDEFQVLNKRSREMYFAELMFILSKNKREFVVELLNKYSCFSTQDVILMLMCNLSLRNKEMAKVLGLTVETLKKRKGRLKSKMLANGLTLQMEKVV